MTWKSTRYTPERSVYGSPRVVVVTQRRSGLPTQAEAWQAARDEFEAHLVEALLAFKKGLITRRQYDSAKARLSSAIRRAELLYEQAVFTHQMPARTRARKRWRR